MTKTGRPKKYKDLVQFNLYIERSDLDVIREAVARLNEKHKTQDNTIATYTRNIISGATKIIKERIDIQDEKKSQSNKDDSNNDD